MRRPFMNPTWCLVGNQAGLALNLAVLQNQRGRQPDGGRELKEGPPHGGPSRALFQRFYFLA